MATVRYYLDTRRKNKDGSYPLRLLVRHYDRFMISTEFSSKKELWSENQYTPQTPNYKARNVALRNLINKVETLLLWCSENAPVRSRRGAFCIVLINGLASRRYNAFRMWQMRSPVTARHRGTSLS